MNDQEDSPFERVIELLPSLAATAANLNEASKALSEIIERTDDALQRLNLGVTAWTQVQGVDNTASTGAGYWSEDLGYSRIGRKWGLALRKIKGEYNQIELEECEEWLFNEAPRFLRIRAITKIPDLIKELDREAKKMVEQLSASINKTAPLVEVIEKSAPAQRSIKKKLRRRL